LGSSAEEAPSLYKFKKKWHHTGLRDFWPVFSFVMQQFYIIISQACQTPFPGSWLYLWMFC
jgi:hypothetical protein